MRYYDLPKVVIGESFAVLLQVLDGENYADAVPDDLSNVTFASQLVNEKGDVISAISVVKLPDGFINLVVDKSVTATWPAGQQRLQLTYEQDGVLNHFLADDYRSNFILIDVINGAD